MFWKSIFKNFVHLLPHLLNFCEVLLLERSWFSVKPTSNSNRLQAFRKLQCENHYCSSFEKRGVSYSDSGNVSTSEFYTKHNDLFLCTFSKPCEKCDKEDEVGLILDYPIQWANQKTFTLVLYWLSVSYSSIISPLSYVFLPPVTLQTMSRSETRVLFI